MRAAAGAAVLAVAATGLSAWEARAADLVAPEPIDYVRVCDAFGPGYYYIPGTDTCLAVAGRIRTDYNYFFATETWNALAGENIGTFDRSANAYRFRARAYLYLDSRTNTEFGLLRTYTEAYWTVDNNGGAAVDVDAAIIQFGGLTFGRTQSFFDFVDAAPGSTGQFITVGYSDLITNVAAYTFAFGNGFTASLSVEDNLSRAAGVVDATGAIDVAGAYLPDLVAVLKVEQEWGAAQLTGALHNVRTVAFGSELGFAVRGGVVVNVPFGSGTQFGLQGAYGYGAISYVYSNPVGGLFLDPTNVFAVASTAVDGVAVGGGIDLTSAFSVAGGVSTNVTPTISASLNAGFTYVDVPTFPIGGFAQDGDFSNFAVESFLGWAPVDSFILGVAAQYQYVDLSETEFVNTAIGIDDDPQLLSVFFRAQRTF